MNDPINNTNLTYGELDFIQRITGSNNSTTVDDIELLSKTLNILTKKKSILSDLAHFKLTIYAMELANKLCYGMRLILDHDRKNLFAVIDLPSIGLISLELKQHPQNGYVQYPNDKETEERVDSFAKKLADDSRIPKNTYE